VDFSKIKVALIGDILIDEYKHGVAERLSPECPVPVVLLKESTKTLGGAGNVAFNLADLGALVEVYSIIGCDRFGGIVLELLGSKNIAFAGLHENGKPTIVKTRILANNHQLLRVDREEKFTLDVTKQICLDTVQAVLISDYAKGTINRNIKKVIEKALSLNIPVFVDPKEKNIDLYKNATVVKLNHKEAFNITGIKNEPLAAKNLLKRLSAKNIVITCGDRGMYVVGEAEGFIDAENKSKFVDVSGAGDTVLATLALSYIITSNILESVKLANKAAGIVVSKRGTGTCSHKELFDE